MRRFLVGAIPPLGTTFELDADASHHLLHVAKLPRGARLGVFDGIGTQAEAELIDGESLARVRICSEPEASRPHHDLHLVLAVLKGDAMSRALRMATEAGATHIWPVLTARTIAKGDHVDRWTRIAASAAQQCGRADVPQVASAGRLEDHELPQGIPRYLAAPNGPTLCASGGAAMVAIGPEGGWTPEEVRTMTAAGWTPAGLGPWVFRADTACAVAIAILASS